MNKYNRFIRKLGNFSYVLSAAMMIAALLINLIPPLQASAAVGTVWTTSITCATPASQDQNQYYVGNTIYARGSGFTSDYALTWEISNTSGSTIYFSGHFYSGVGNFCITTHTIQPGETGVYKLTISVDSTGVKLKSDNYSVDAQNPLSLVKIGVLDLGGNGVLNAGDIINYSLTVTNSNKNQDLTNVSVTDPLLGTIICPGGNPIPTLAKKSSLTCTGTYTITQDDIDAGHRDNTAVADSDQTGPVTDSFNVPLTASPAISISKTGALDLGNGVLNVGDVINYSLVVTNTGNATLTNVTVSDPLLGTIVCPGGNGTFSLDPSAFVTCTGSYAITQADINAGHRANTASATSVQAGPVIGSYNVPLIASPAISISKTGVLELGNGVLNAGDVINYSLVVTNTGNATLTNVTVSDPLLTSIVCPDTNGTFSLELGAFVTCTGSYAITQADINAGHRDNTATADSDQTVPVTDSFDVTLTTNPSISISKTGVLDKGSDGVLNEGDVINYELVVSNNGNVTLTKVTVSDLLLGTITCQGGSNPIASLALGASETCTGAYSVKQSDIDAELRANTASATSDQAGPETDSFNVPLTAPSAISLSKTGVLDKGGDGVLNEGDVINYSLVVTNTGNATLTNVTVSDPLLTTIVCLGGNGTFSLDPGAFVTCTGSYTILQSDITAGHRANTASATSDQAGPVDASFNVPLTANPPDTVTICYNGVTMTVPVADLGQYPGYVLGACLPPPPPPRPEDPVSVTRDCAGFTLHNGNEWLVNGSWEIEGTDLSGKFSLGAKESVTINTGFQTGDLLVNHGDHAFRVAAYTACGEILIPVTGMDTGAAGRFGSQYLFLASIAFFGFGLMLNGYARKHEEEDL